MSEPSICTKVTRKLLSEIKDEGTKRLLELTFKCLAGREVQDEKQKEILEKRLQKERTVRLREQLKHEAYKLSRLIYDLFGHIVTEGEWCVPSDEW